MDSTLTALSPATAAPLAIPARPSQRRRPEHKRKAGTSRYLGSCPPRDRIFQATGHRWIGAGRDEGIEGPNAPPATMHKTSQQICRVSDTNGARC